MTGNISKTAEPSMFIGTDIRVGKSHHTLECRVGSCAIHLSDDNDDNDKVISACPRMGPGL